MYRSQPTLRKYLQIYLVKKNVKESQSPERVRSTEKMINRSRIAPSVNGSVAEKGFKTKINEIKDGIAIYISDMSVQDDLFKKLDELEEMYQRDTLKVRLEEQVIQELTLTRMSHSRALSDSKTLRKKLSAPNQEEPQIVYTIKSPIENKQKM